MEQPGHSVDLPQPATAPADIARLRNHSDEASLIEREDRAVIRYVHYAI